MLRRLLVFLVCLSVIISCFACGGNKPSGSEEKPAELTAWTMHGFEKTVVNSTPRGEFSADYTVYMSKGEAEGCQVAVYSESKISNVTLDMKSGETELIKPSMYSMNKTQKVGRKQYTDALIPYYGRRLVVEEKIILPFMIEFKTDETTPAGDYEYVYELKERNGNVLATYNITVHVWDFVLPEDNTFVTAVGLHKPFIYYYNGVYQEWYDTLLDHNMSAYELPYDILDARADVYMSDPRVTSFCVPIPKNEDDTINESKLIEYYNKLKINKDWLEKAYFYPLDEPRTEQHLTELKEWEEKLGELCPKIEIMAPFYTNIQIGEERDQTDFMEEITDLWCPKLCLWDDVKSYDEFLNYKPDKSFEERMNEQIAKGDRMWTYVCNDPNNPYAQLFLDTEGVHQRLMFWQIYQRDIGGFLYCSACWYLNNRPFGDGGSGMLVCEDPWGNGRSTVDGDGNPIYGDGWLLYPGLPVGCGGACPSIRAKIVRDGIDDIEMFYLAEKYLDKDWIMTKTREGTPTLTEYVSGDEYIKLRVEIGNALEAAMKK